VSWPPERDIVIGFDLRPEGVYISAECQLGAHWGCPGGLRGDTTRADLICHCREETCACHQKLTT
jgi:hypothetical protein